MTLSRSCLLGTTAAALLAIAALPAQAADPAKQISTAVTHAGLAASANDVKMVQTHLHHVINCLVGPNGAEFDAGPGNPCKDQGAGAIPDSPAAKQAALKSALEMAKKDLTQTDLGKAKEQATALQNELKQAM